MKSLLTILVGLFIMTVSYGQSKSYSVDEYGRITYTLTDDNCNLKEKGEYLNCKKHGTWRSYHPNGKIQAIATYRNDKRDGKWKFYKENGDLEAILVFNNNKRERAIVHQTLVYNF